VPRSHSDVRRDGLGLDGKGNGKSILIAVSAKTSVIVCAYNYARFLPRCLESVISQSRPADEIILVDDGSTDQTPSVVSGFRSVRYIRQERAGKAAAFNLGFDASKGDLILHLDADDYWLPDKLKRVTEVLSRGLAGGLIHEAFYVDAEGSYLYGSEREAENIFALRHFSLRDVLFMCFTYRPGNTIASNLGVANTVCVWKEAVADIFPLPTELGLAVDGALLLGTARRGLVYLPEKLSAYRHHGNNFFVGNAGSYESQRRLFKWVPSMPGLMSGEVQKLSQALLLETEVQLAMRGNKEPLRTAFKAAVLNTKLVQLGLVPHWKHLGLPIASLIGWARIRRSLSRATSIF
jgi:glycosyltransferase involved in cell wall biosynthesis